MASRQGGHRSVVIAALVALSLAAFAGSSHAQEMTEKFKADIRQDNGYLFQRIVNSIKQHFTLTTPPYLDGPYSDGHGGTEMRFLKDWHLWTKEDLYRLNPEALQVIHNMAEYDDYAHLSQILPDYYRANGGVHAFAQDIESVTRQQGMVFHGS